MTKAQLVDSLSKKSNESKVTVDAVLDSLIEVVSEEVLDKGDTVFIPGLGTFKQKKTEARTGRNPKTGDTLQISAKTKVGFSPASSMKK